MGLIGNPAASMPCSCEKTVRAIGERVYTSELRLADLIEGGGLPLLFPLNVASQQNVFGGQLAKPRLRLSVAHGVSVSQALAGLIS
jgi:hypothetical protein